MRFMRTKSLLLLALVAACSTAPQQTALVSSDSNRDIASAAAVKEIPYPADFTWDMKDLKGQTYITFLKKQLKPAMEKLDAKENGGGGGFKNEGSAAFLRGGAGVNPTNYVKYKGAKWNRASKSYEGDLSDEEVAKVYDKLAELYPKSSIYWLGYYDKNDKAWPTKNHMNQAMKAAKVTGGNNFDLGTLYALTSGIGTKVRIDKNNANYHVMYLTGKYNSSTQVMSGRSFASGPGRGAADATDPQYLDDLEKYLIESKADQKPFYRALILALADTDPTGWAKLSKLGQAVLSDFFTVYTAEAIRHLMVNLQVGKHPWEIDLAAVTLVSSVSQKLGKVVVDGQFQDGDIGQWFAPSPNNKPGGPQRSGIGITRRDRKIFQAAIHKYEATQADGKKVIAAIQKIIGTGYKNDVIQGVFEYLSNVKTPATMGANAEKLADLVAEFIELANEDADEIAKLL